MGGVPTLQRNIIGGPLPSELLLRAAARDRARRTPRFIGGFVLVHIATPGTFQSMERVRNPFVARDAARRYREYRPDYSAHLAAILERAVGRVTLALDVAAGTGISTLATSSVADVVVSVDASPAMVAYARTVPTARWLIGGAEALPFRDGAFDLITVGSALHWFHRDSFTAQAVRVARPGAYLVVHDHGFTGQMEDVGEFHDWIHHRYLRGYPSPPRGQKLAPGTDLGPFRFQATYRYEQPVVMTCDQLAGYLTTQSNLQVVMTSAPVVSDVVNWLEKEINPFFIDADERTVRFAGMATILKRS